MATNLANSLNLRELESFWHAKARDQFDKGESVLWMASNRSSIGIVLDNVSQFKDRGIYETCLLEAVSGSRVNNSDYPEQLIHMLYYLADKQKLKDAGTTPPAVDSLRIYRGVSGHGAARRIRGYSWTTSIDVACWFALRFSRPRPAVFTTVIAPQQALAFLFGDAGRNEDEVIYYAESDFCRAQMTQTEIAQRSEHAIIIRAREQEKTLAKYHTKSIKVQ